MSESVLQDGKIFLGKSVKPEYLDLSLANRHGLVTGATGTGKTVTLQVLAEGFSRAGVPVFAADIKGDLSGIAEVGEPKDFLLKRAEEVGLERLQEQRFARSSSGTCSAPAAIRSAPPSQDMGPLLLSRMLELNEVQEGVLNIAFRVAADEKLPLLDLERPARHHQQRRRARQGAARPSTATSRPPRSAPSSAACWCSRSRAPTTSSASRRSTSRTSSAPRPDGRGVVNILSADKLMEKPRLYATFLLWMLTKLWQTLPEVGDQPQAQARVLLRRGASAVRRRAQGAARPHRADRPPVRSKGVGVYFVTQNPLDVPEHRLRPARQPRAARAARLHAARAEGSEGGGRNLPPQSRSSTPSASSWN